MEALLQIESSILLWIPCVYGLWMYVRKEKTNKKKQ